MPPTTRYRRGDIVLVSLPFTDLTSSKRRPALVISPNAFNEHGEDLVVKVAKIFTMHSTLVRKRICVLRQEKLAEVFHELRGFLS